MKKLLIWRSRKTKTTKISKSTWLIAKVSRKDPSVRTFCNFKLLITTSPHMPIWIRLITSLLNYSIKILWISAKSLLTRTINQGLISLGGSIRVIDRALCMGCTQTLTACMLHTANIQPPHANWAGCTCTHRFVIFSADAGKADGQCL